MRVYPYRVYINIYAHISAALCSLWFSVARCKYQICLRCVFGIGSLQGLCQ